MLHIEMGFSKIMCNALIYIFQNVENLAYDFLDPISNSFQQNDGHLNFHVICDSKFAVFLYSYSYRLCHRSSENRKEIWKQPSGVLEWPHN